MPLSPLNCTREPAEEGHEAYLWGEQKRRQRLPRALVFLEAWIAYPVSQVCVDLQGQSQQGEWGFHPHPIGAGGGDTHWAGIATPRVTARLPSFTGPALAGACVYTS